MALQIRRAVAAERRRAFLASAGNAAIIVVSAVAIFAYLFLRP